MPPKLIGITGGIGSGKSLISRVLEVLDFFIYNSDKSAKEVVNLPKVRQQLIETFGDQAFDENDEYNRPYIAQLVFNDKEKLDQLNSIIHPAVQNHFNDWVKQHEDQKILFKEAAILFETGTYKKLDATILVTAPKELRVQRVVQRDEVSCKEVYSRMERQWSDEEKRKLADFIVENDDETMVIPQIYDILSRI